MGHQMVMCVRKPKTKQREESMFEDLQCQREILQDKPISRSRVFDFLTEEAKDNVRNEEIARRMEKTELAEKERLEQYDKKKMEDEKMAETLKAKSEKKQMEEMLKSLKKLRLEQEAKDNVRNEEIARRVEKTELAEKERLEQKKMEEEKTAETLKAKSEKKQVEEMLKSLKILRLEQEAKTQKEQTDLEHTSKSCQTKKMVENQMEKVEFEEGWKMCGEETFKRPKCHQENNEEQGQNSYIHIFEETCIFAAVRLKPTTTSFHNEHHKEPTRMKNETKFVVPKKDALQPKKQNLPWCICL